MNEVRQAFGRYGYAALIFLHCGIFVVSVLYLLMLQSGEYCFLYGYITVAGYVINYLWYFMNRAERDVSFPTTVLLSGTGFGLTMHVCNFIFFAL